MRLTLVCFFVLMTFLIACSLKESSISPALPYIPPPLSKLEQWKKNKLSKQIQAYFQESLLRYPGAFNGGILVAKGGHVLYENYQGFKDLPQKKDPLDESASLHIASTSKTFTAIAILQLIQDNKLSLTDKIESFFKGWPYPGITIRDLLNHRSGLPNYVYFMEPAVTNFSKEAVTNTDHRLPIERKAEA